MQVTITGEVGTSSASPAAGRIEFSQAQRLDTGEMLVTSTPAVAQVINGELKTLAGKAFTLPSNPEGTAVRIREVLGGETFEWWAAVPEQEFVEYRLLPLVESADLPASVFGPPYWLTSVEQMRDETVQAISDGTAVAEALGGLAGINDAVASASSSATSAEDSAVRAQASADSIDTTGINERLDGMDTSISDRPTTSQVSLSLELKADKTTLNAYTKAEERKTADARLISLFTAGRTIVAMAGASTTSVGGYPSGLARQIQSRWRPGRFLTLAAATGSTFHPGLHVVNGGSSGKNARNYLAEGRADAISALNVNVVIHTIGINDWNSGRVPSEYAAEVEAALALITSTNPLIHIFVHEHERNNIAIPTQYNWDDFGAALKSVADADPANRIFVDASNVFRQAGVGMGLDNKYGLLEDGTHLTTHGQHVMGNVVANLLGVGGTASSEWIPIPFTKGTGTCEYRSNGNRFELRFDITYTLAAGVSEELFSVPVEARPGLLTPVDVGSTGFKDYWGSLAPAGAVTIVNGSTSGRTRFWGKCEYSN